MTAALGLMILIQSMGFHMQFVFRDGMDGTKRDTTLTEPSVVAGMKTTQANAESLSGLLSYIQNEEIEEDAIYFGDCPGLSFLLQKPAAIDSTWPDLDSFTVEQLEENLLALKQKPLIVMRHTDPTSVSFVEKKEMLQDYMSAKHYEVGYENKGYTVYQPLEK